MKHKNIGSNFEDFLEEEGLLDGCREEARKKIDRWIKTGKHAIVIGHEPNTGIDGDSMKHKNIGWIPPDIKRVIYYMPQPKNDDELEKMIELSLFLIGQIGEDENHPLKAILEVVGNLIEEYENEPKICMEAV